MAGARKGTKSSGKCAANLTVRSRTGSEAPRSLLQARLGQLPEAGVHERALPEKVVAAVQQVSLLFHIEWGLRVLGLGPFGQEVGCIHCAAFR